MSSTKQKDRTGEGTDEQESKVMLSALTLSH